MHKVFKYRLYPSRQQQRVLGEHLEACRRLYNTFVCDRVQAYQDRGAWLSMYDQLGTLPFLKTEMYIAKYCKMWASALIWPLRRSTVVR